MSRAGLSPGRVVETAARLIDAHGLEAVTLASVAQELGVRTPSLYSHVGGLDDLRRSVGLRALEVLDEACRTAAMGKAGGDALRAVAGAYRTVARAHPGTYPLTQPARTGDAEWDRVSARVLEPLLAALHGMGIKGVAAIHDVRTLRSALHGFVLLELQGGFGLQVSLDRSFERMVDHVLVGIAAGAKEGSRRSG
jgi:AcrR family transcriptional regulator